jgi:O-antigen biosynthesis protein
VIASRSPEALRTIPRETSIGANGSDPRGNGIPILEPPLAGSAAAQPSTIRRQRPEVRGKFLYVGGEKLWIRGVTYGTFRPDPAGNPYGSPEQVARDFRDIVANGFNAIRTYTVPPRWLLDLAERYRLRVMIGLPWEQHVAFLDDPARAWSIEERVREGVQACAGHPAVLWYAIGNEIPSPIVRWHGRRRIERYLERLYRAVKAEDPWALVTYVNYPSTEYLALPFLDVVCFNVYLEAQERLEAYLARLHNLAGDRPVVMAELGLDSRRHGLATQAQVLEWQVRTTFTTGCAGLFVFSWTDEWHRGGHDVLDWDFGLTTRDRGPKPALAAVRRTLAETPFAKTLRWPRVSVVVCSYNGARTIRDCFEGLRRLAYPDFEVIVVNDGSSDATPAIAREYGFRVIDSENGGLSRARNLGLHAASGEIVAYLDDDAYPDPHWLRYLAWTFLHTTHVGVGGPNIPPPGDGPVAEGVARAPGGPLHVLLSDREAEHIPGCNMAFRRRALEAIGGFDPQFRTAGDDVDICWRLRQKGGTLGFHPAAMVWHHRRNSVQAYWKQQVGYGRAEALLERKWPEKYNTPGHLRWMGRLYGGGATRALGLWRERVYQGAWGSAPFQSVYQPAPGTLASLPLMPEWYLVILVLLIASGLSLHWPLLAPVVPLAAVAVGAALLQAVGSAVHACAVAAGRAGPASLRLLALTTSLHLLQPLARLTGRLGHGLSPWRRRLRLRLHWPWPRSFAVWRERGRPPVASLAAIRQALRAVGACVRAGGDFDDWDLEVRVGALGAVRVLMTTEEHGEGRQLLRFRAWPRATPGWLCVIVLGAILTAAAAASEAWIEAAVLGAGTLLGALRLAADCGSAMDAVCRTVPAARALEAKPRTERAEGAVEQVA